MQSTVNSSASFLSLVWLWIKIALYLVLALGSMDVVVVAYQQF